MDDELQRWNVIFRKRSDKIFTDGSSVLGMVGYLGKQIGENVCSYKVNVSRWQIIIFIVWRPNDTRWGDTWMVEMRRTLSFVSVIRDKTRLRPSFVSSAASVTSHTHMRQKYIPMVGEKMVTTKYVDLHEKLRFFCKIGGFHQKRQKPQLGHHFLWWRL